MAKGSLVFVTDLTMMPVETFCEVEEVYLLQVVGKSRVAQNRTRGWDRQACPERLRRPVVIRQTILGTPVTAHHS